MSTAQRHRLEVAAELVVIAWVLTEWARWIW